MMTTIQSNKNKASIKLALFILLTVLNTSCDFSPRIHNKILIAQTYITNSEYEKAVKQYLEILEEVPPKEIKIKIYYQLGELYAISLAQYNNGIEYYEKIKTLTNEPLWLVKTQERIGEIAFAYMKDYQKTAKVYEELMSFRPKLNNYELYEYRYATSLIELDKYDEALKVLIPIQSNSNHQYNAEAFFLNGMLYYNHKEWQKCVNYLREYIKREKRKDRIVNAKFIMANAYETMERLKQAYDMYYSIISDYPNTDIIKSRLKSVYERRVARRR